MGDIMGKIILDLCGGTGSWSKPYKDAGYDVRLITLPEHDVRTYVPPDNVYGVLASPPCTMFSFARTTAKTPRDITGALSVVDSCIRVAFICKPKFWCLENPRGLLRKYLNNPTITIQPYWFGDNHSKHTDLWGNFTIPGFSPIRLTEEEIHRARQNSRKLPKILGLTQADRRAITPAGFANAFFKANQ
jgi:hypothetical protein